MRHIFFSTILVLSFVLNFYVLWRLAGLLAIKRGWIFWLVVIICSSSLIISSLIRGYSDTIISKFQFMVVTDWYGILWLLFCTLLVYEFVRLFVNIKPQTAGFGIIGIVAVLTIYSMINTQFIKVKKLTLKANVNRNIVVVSDVHIGSVSKMFFKRIINKINSEKPDMVLIVGDLVDNIKHTSKEALVELKAINVPILFSTGNHESYAGLKNVQGALEKLGIRVLRNERVDYNDIEIIGIDNDTDADEIKGIYDRLYKQSKYCILMYHKPLDLNMLSDIGADLTLSGHTHKGQIFPFYFVVKYFFPEIYGLYDYNGGKLLVSSGAGTWGPRMRLGTNAEIISLQLRTDY